MRGRKPGEEKHPYHIRTARRFFGARIHKLLYAEVGRRAEFFAGDLDISLSRQRRARAARSRRHPRARRSPSSRTSLPFIDGARIILVEQRPARGSPFAAAVDPVLRLRAAVVGGAAGTLGPQPPRAAHPARLRRKNLPTAPHERIGAGRGSRQRRRGRPRAQGGVARIPSRTWSASRTFPGRHRLLLDAARASCRPEHEHREDATLRGRRSSTSSGRPRRARRPADLAAKRLSADTLALKSSGSGRREGRDLKDTAVSLSASRPTSSSCGTPRPAPARRSRPTPRRASSTPATASTSIHTQCLLDLFSMRQNLGRDLDGLKVFIIGDILHSRVARSDIMGFQMLGMDVTLVAPPTLMPRGIEGDGRQGRVRPRQRGGRRRHLPAAHPEGAHQAGLGVPALAA